MVNTPAATPCHKESKQQLLVFVGGPARSRQSPHLRGMAFGRTMVEWSAYGKGRTRLALLEFWDGARFGDGEMMMSRARLGMIQ